MNKIKIIAAICVYNDYEFLSETIDSISPFVDQVNIIEGAWQTAIDVGANKRSNNITLDIIKSKLNDKIKYHPVNKHNETAQRQEAIDICKSIGGDFVICPDADEVFTPESIKNVINSITDIYHKGEYFGVKLCSYNFFNGFNQYFHGCYPRAYKLTDDLTCFNTNHFYWPNHNRGISNYIELDKDDHKFYHFSYVRKNIDLFHIKMKFLEKEFGQNLYERGYGVDNNGVYSMPSDQYNFKTFNTPFPDNIQKIIDEWNRKN